MRNKVAGKCRDCGAHVAEGAGYFERVRRGFSGTKWVVRCILCTAKGKQARGDTLTPPQAQALRAQP